MWLMLWIAPVEEGTFAPFLPSIVRLSISAFRAEDPGSNPGRSTKHYLSCFFMKEVVFNIQLFFVS